MLVVIVLSALSATPRTAPPTASWDFLEDPPPRVRAKGPAPTSVSVREALDDMQGALGQWEAERREFNRDVGAREEARRSREERAEIAPHSGASRPSKRFGKIIEVAPAHSEEGGADGEADALPSGDSVVVEEIRRVEQELRERQRRCQEDPEWCEKEKERRRIVREGNKAWDEAIEQKRRAREAAIEAEARRIQAELDAARRREAEERARKLGGALDQNGNFVDRDLDQEIEQDAQKKR